MSKAACEVFKMLFGLFKKKLFSKLNPTIPTPMFELARELTESYLQKNPDVNKQEVFASYVLKLSRKK